MGRRKMALTSDDEKVLKAIFEETAPERENLRS
jgi:hypothetical protein